jgi:hypothetical protein
MKLDGLIGGSCSSRHVYIILPITIGAVAGIGGVTFHCNAFSLRYNQTFFQFLLFDYVSETQSNSHSAQSDKKQEEKRDEYRFVAAIELFACRLFGSGKTDSRRGAVYSVAQ